MFLLYNGEAIEYKGAFGQADILKFVAKNVKTVKENWEAKVTSLSLFIRVCVYVSIYIHINIYTCI
jgi:hypothetical protein